MKHWKLFSDGYFISDEKSVGSKVHELCSNHHRDTFLLQIKNEEEFKTFKTIIEALDRPEVDFIFFDLNQELEFSNFFPSEIPTKTENQIG